jgi:hypothetical protein
MRSFKTLLLTVFILLACTPVAIAQIPLSDKATVSLLTCGPGDELYSVYGHTAIRVHDPLNGIDTVYNYGTFDFGAPNFYLRFVKGDLQYFVSVSSYTDFVEQYIYYDRDVFEQVLNLEHEQVQKIADELNTVLLSDKRFYTYKFIGRNCTTMVADVISNSVQGNISDDVADKGQTYREILYRYQKDLFYENLGINLIFGHKTDRKLNSLFLPQQLMEGVSKTTINSKPLSQPAVIINKSKSSVQGFSLFNNYYAFAAILIIIMLFARKRVVYTTFLAISGLVGLFFSTVGLYSLHEEILLNYNILLINPLFLLLLYFIARNNKIWITRLVYVCMALLALYIVYMLTKPHLLLVLPLIALTAVILLRVLNSTGKNLSAKS